jgi:hypothetical protein
MKCRESRGLLHSMPQPTDSFPAIPPGKHVLHSRINAQIPPRTPPPAMESMTRGRTHPQQISQQEAKFWKSRPVILRRTTIAPFFVVRDESNSQSAFYAYLPGHGDAMHRPAVPVLLVGAVRNDLAVPDAQRVWESNKNSPLRRQKSVAATGKTLFRNHTPASGWQMCCHPD